MGQNRLAVVMVGPPGAGKGTQARRLAAEVGFPHISTGDILREAVRNQSELGKRAQSYMDSGGLVPDELVDAIVKERLARPDCAAGVILDGYPRTIPQATFLDSIFAGASSRVISIGVAVGTDEILNRLATRWTCPNCGKMFNFGQAPGAGKRCDECNTELVHRQDDSAAVISERLQVYERNTKPLVQYFKDKGAYFEVDGERTVDEIYPDIVGIVKAQLHDTVGVQRKGR